MNHKEIQKAVWDESMEFINRKEDCDNAPMLVKLQTIFTKYQNKNHWKNPFTAVNVPNEEVEWLKAGIEWFHGAEPQHTQHAEFANVVSSFGYACD